MNEIFNSTYNMDIININITKYYRMFFLHHVLKLNLLSGVMLNKSGYEAYTITGIDAEEASSIYEIPLHGYSYYEKDGKNFTLYNISYNFPIAWIERGVKNMPVLLRYIWMKTYYEGGNVFNKRNNFIPLQTIGAELGFKFYVYYRFNSDLSFGISHELDRQQKTYYYLNLKAGF